VSKLISLEVSNVKRIKAVEIHPDATMNVLAGKNGNGKSSILDSIEYALGGAKTLPERAIRDGEEEARIVLTTDDFVITRNWTSNDKSYLKVEMKDGGKISDGQTVLNKLVGNLSFDPLEFSTIEPKKRLEILKKIAKLDFSQIDKEYDSTFQERTALNRDITSLDAIAKSFSDVLIPTIDFSIIEVKEEKESLAQENKKIEEINRQHNHKLMSLRHNKELAELSLKNTEKEVERLEIELSRATEKRNHESERIKNLTKEINDNDQEVLQGPHELSSFDEKILRYQEYQSKLSLIEKKNQTLESLKEKQARSEELTKKLQSIKQSKIDMISSAKMPIEGLAVSDDDILFGGIPFAQLCTSEQIKISMSIAMALNPRLRVVIIKNGSLLDSDAMTAIKKLAEENDFQCFVERVADKPEENCIYIEDGMIK